MNVKTVVSAVVAKARVIGFMLLSVPTSLLLWPVAAMAQNLGDIGNNVASQMNGLAAMFHMGGILIGLILVIVGIIKFAHHRTSKEPLMVPIMMLVAGILLMGIGAFISIGSQSLLGGGSASSGASQLGVN